jgi:hypothetical protein
VLAAQNQGYRKDVQAITVGNGQRGGGSAQRIRPRSGARLPGDRRSVAVTCLADALRSPQPLTFRRPGRRH